MKKITILFILFLISIIVLSLASQALASNVGITTRTLDNLAPGDELIEKRTRTSKLYWLGGDSYAVAASVAPVHYLDSQAVWQLINTEFKPVAAPWDWEVNEAGYTTRIKEGFTAGQIIDYEKSGHHVFLQPMALKWTNQLGQIDQISMPQDVPAVVTNKVVTMVEGVESKAGTIEWANAYGEGIDFTYMANPASLAKLLTISGYNDLPPPAQYILDGANPALALDFILDPDPSLGIYYDGIEWDKKTAINTLNPVEFRFDGVTLFSFRPPAYWESGESDTYFTGTTLSKSGNSLYVAVAIPYEWLQTASYPVSIDPTIDEEVVANADDGGCYNDVDFSSTLAAHYIGAGGSGDYAIYTRFTGITLEGTIDDAVLTIYVDGHSGDVELKVTMVDEDNPPAPTSAAEFVADPLTTAGYDWDFTPDDDVWTSTANTSMNDAVQEIVNSYTIDNEAIMVRVDDDNAATGKWLFMRPQNNGYPPRFYAEYTVGGGGASVTTNAAVQINNNSANVSGNVTALTGDNVTTRGVSAGYSADNYTVSWWESGNWGDTGYFSGNLTGLTPASKVFHRAWADNGSVNGTGSELDFVTDPDPPTNFVESENSTHWYSVNWTAGAGASVYEIRSSTTAYPSSNVSGSLAYWGASVSANITRLISDETFYLTLYSHAYVDSQWVSSTPVNLTTGTQYYADAVSSPEWTFVVFPDTQHSLSATPIDPAWVSQTDYIEIEQSRMNIQAVFNVGDIVDNANLDAQLDRALIGMTTINGTGIPIALTVGNHDYSDADDLDVGNVTHWLERFGTSFFSGQSYFGDNYTLAGDNATNMYIKFTVEGHNYIIMALENFPDTASLTWAQGIIDDNPTYEVILTTHAFLDKDGTLLDALDTYGAEDYVDNYENRDAPWLWDNFIKVNPEIFLVVSGHVIGNPPYTATWNGTNDAGNTVNAIYTNYQSYVGGKYGVVNLLRFRPAQNQIVVTTYSPHNGVMLADNYTLEYDWEGGLSVTTNAAADVSYTSVTGSGNVTSISGNITERGFQYGIGAFSANVSEGGDWGVGGFTLPITGLTHNTEYQYRAYATDNESTTGYGASANFTTLELLAPEVVTGNATAISYFTATGQANIVTITGENATVRGGEWGLAPATYSANWTEGGDFSTGNFTYAMTGLPHDTTIYTRALAVNSINVSYGAEVSFSTLTVVIPTVTTSTATGVSSSGATLSGNITATGGQNGSVAGAEWGTASGNYTANQTSGGSFGVGTFSEIVGGLSANTTYYFRAVVVNIAGVAYGAEDSFTTDVAAAGLPSPPTDVLLTQVSADSVNLTWATGALATTTVIRVSTTSYPTSPTDGYLADNTTLSTLLDSGLSLVVADYYYSLWSWNDLGYSESYATVNREADLAIITGGDMEEVGNQLGGLADNAFEVVVLFAILTLAFWQKEYVLYFVAGISTIIIAAGWMVDYTGVAVALIALAVYLFVKAIILVGETTAGQARGWSQLKPLFSKAKGKFTSRES